MARRIFIAINTPDKIKEELVTYQEKIQGLFTPHRNEVSGAGPCRWLKKETFHITLAFIGYLNEEELQRVFEVVKRIGSSHKPFLIVLDRVCYGPPKEMPPRLVYARAQGITEFLDLQKDLERELVASKINFRSKRQAHITLARIKKWNWQRLNPEERPEIDLPISIEIPVNSIEVMESHLKRTGAEYEILESVPLSK